MPKKRLILIDGQSLVNRAFYALPPLTNKEGVHTNGVYGFLTMLYKIFDDYNPDYIGVAFDKKGPTFRHEEFGDYKAGRKRMPDELREQIPILKDVLDKLNIYRIELDGFEADDLVGTLVSYGEENKLEVITVSGDKDYLQLASDETKVLFTKRGMTDLDVYDKDEMLNRYELTPQQFIDLKGLMGDKSDNIPGVPGVGEKTGIKLLKEFGSIEGIYENIESVKGKLKEKLIDNKQQAFMSKRLATIIRNVPIDLDIEKLKKEDPKYDEIFEIYKKLGFNSLLDKVHISDEKGEIAINNSKNLVEDTLEIISDITDLKAIIDNIKNKNKIYFKFIIDSENTINSNVIGMIIKYDDEKIYYIDFEKIDINDVLKDLKEIFEDEKIKKSGHNIKEDILILLKLDIDLKGIDFDSVIGQYIIDPSQSEYSIKKLAQEYLNMSAKDEEEVLGKGKSKKLFKDLSLNDRSDYFSNIIRIVYSIEEKIKNIIKDQNMERLFYEVEMPLCKVLANMEYEGFKVDIEKLEELGEELDKKIEILKESIYNLSGEEFNINSPKQLGVILFEKLELPVIKKTKTGYSTNAEVLDKLLGKHAIIDKILDYRQLVKIKSTYIEGLMSLVDSGTNKVHSSFNQTITTTGRISSTEPNLQNIPIRTEEGRKIRKVFVVRDKDYKLVDADYSQIELRVLAHISDDEKLKEAFYSEEDIHTKTASEVFDVPKEEVTSLMRSRAKAVNFGIVYGISDYGLSRDLNITRKEAKVYIDNYLANYPKVKEYMDNIIDSGKKDGYVETILNRRRYLPELKSKNFNIRSFGERMAMNTPIQGSAADIIKIAMVKVFNELRERKMKSRLILQVHDELIIEAHKDEAEDVKSLLRNLMESAIELKVPLKVDMEIGDSWYDTK